MDRDKLDDLHLILLFLMAGLLVLLLISVVVEHHLLPPAPAPVCQEDEACWNCRTMGNRICGPGAPHPAGHY